MLDQYHAVHDDAAALDENAQYTVYQQRQALLNMGGLIYDTHAGEGASPNLFVGQLSYGINHGVNPYPTPGNPPNASGDTPLSATGNYPDIGRADVRAVWGQQYRHLVVDLGLDMIWQDMMCPAMARTFSTFPLDLMIFDGHGYVPNGAAHNTYGMHLLMATSEGVGALQPDRRPFIIARGGYAGMQRYAALCGRGFGLELGLPEDQPAGGAQSRPERRATVGLRHRRFGPGSGSVGDLSYDHRGGVFGNITNYELLTRWMHLGSFLPWYRNHYYGYEKQFQEPYAYGEPVPTHCRKYVELRYRMLQLYYDAYWEWTQTGMPIARALFLNDPQDPQIYDHVDDTFFVGSDLLVAPILFPGEGAPPVATRSVYLPAGSAWYAYMDGGPLAAPVPGARPLRPGMPPRPGAPLRARGGDHPMRGLQQWVGELPVNPLDIHIYPGKASRHVLLPRRRGDDAGRAPAGLSDLRDRSRPGCQWPDGHAPAPPRPVPAPGDRDDADALGNVRSALPHRERPADPSSARHERARMCNRRRLRDRRWRAGVTDQADRRPTLPRHRPRVIPADPPAHRPAEHVSVRRGECGTLDTAEHGPLRERRPTMIERTAARRPARMSFTADFHELVRGDLARSSSVLLRYDPLRIVPPGDAYVFGDPNRPVMVHARFGGAATVTLPLASRVGILPERPNDKTGNGNMLVGRSQYRPTRATSSCGSRSRTRPERSATTAITAATTVSVSRASRSPSSPRCDRRERSEPVRDKSSDGRVRHARRGSGA